MSPPNPCGISFSSFSSFLDSSGTCLESVYEETTQIVDEVVENTMQSADALNYASENFTLDRGVTGFIDDFLFVRSFQEIGDRLTPFRRGLSTRLTQLGAAGVGPVVSLETGVRMCLPSEIEIDCGLVSHSDCEGREPPLLIHEDLWRALDGVPPEERVALLTQILEELHATHCSEQRPPLLIRADIMDRIRPFISPR